MWKAVAGTVPSPEYILPTFLLNFVDSGSRQGTVVGSLLAEGRTRVLTPEDASRKYSRQTIY